MRFRFVMKRSVGLALGYHWLAVDRVWLEVDSHSWEVDSPLAAAGVNLLHLLLKKGKLLNSRAVKHLKENLSLK